MNSVAYKAANQSASGKCSPVIPCPVLAVKGPIPTPMKSMITMIVVMIVMTVLLMIEASYDMLPVVDIMAIPSGMIGMMIGMVIGMMLLMIGMMLMIDLMLVIV